MIDQESEIMTINPVEGETIKVKISKPERYSSMELVGQFVDIQLQRSINLIPMHTTSDWQHQKILVNDMKMIRTDRDDETDPSVFSAYVDKIDLQQKRLYLKDPDGNQVLLEVNENNHDYKGINAGDTVLVQYSDTMVIIVRDNEKQTIIDKLERRD